MYMPQSLMGNSLFENLLGVDELPDIPFTHRRSSRNSNTPQRQMMTYQLNDIFPGLNSYESSIYSVDNLSQNNPGLSQEFYVEDAKKQEVQTGAGFVDTTQSKLIVRSQKEPEVQESVIQVEPSATQETQQIESDDFESIFTEQKIKGGFKKNTNVPKFIVRIFMKHFSAYAKKHNSEAILKHHKKVKKQLTARTSNNYTISDVLTLFRDTNGMNDEVRRLNQKVMAQIIGQTLNDEVIENKYIKSNRTSYMLAMKIYALRCRSRTLSERVKIF